MVAPGDIVTTWLVEVRRRFAAAADPDRAAAARRLFPSDPPILGLPSGLARREGLALLAALRAHAQGDEARLTADIVAAAGALFASGVMEEGACANELLGRFWRHLGPDHWAVFDTWIDGFTCWGTADSFCLKCAGLLLLRDGPPRALLADWATRSHVWHRRVALAVFIPAGRKGRYVDDLCAIADRLLNDAQDIVQKAIGWTLKELYKGAPQAAMAYLMAHRDEIPRATLTHALERMSPQEKALVRGLG